MTLPFSWFAETHHYARRNGDRPDSAIGKLPVTFKSDTISEVKHRRRTSRDKQIADLLNERLKPIYRIIFA